MSPKELEARGGPQFRKRANEIESKHELGSERTREQNRNSLEMKLKRCPRSGRSEHEAAILKTVGELSETSEKRKEPAN